MTHHHDPVHGPAHYTYSEIEPIDAIEAWGLGFHLGNVVKYLARAGHKGSRMEDLRKAAWYLHREIDRCDEDPEEADEESVNCRQCSGTGQSRYSNRPDDYGPHTRCFACQGTGKASHRD
jgi:hypothetical protein